MQEAIDFVGYTIERMTGSSDCFRIESVIDENGVLLTAHISSEWAGRVIGKEGKNALAIRTILRAIGHKNSARYSLVVVTESA